MAFLTFEDAFNSPSPSINFGYLFCAKAACRLGGDEHIVAQHIVVLLVVIEAFVSVLFGVSSSFIALFLRHLEYNHACGYHLLAAQKHPLVKTACATYCLK